MKRYLPQAVLATSVVIFAPALLVWSALPSRSPYMLVLSAPLTILLSVSAAHVGSALWARRPGSGDVVFADLMLWGWLRRSWTEHRIGQAQRILGVSPGGTEWERLSSARRLEVLERLIGMLEARDVYTLGHTRRVARHAERIARTMRLPSTEVAKIRTAAALHDIGKAHTPRAILNKPGRLTVEEFAVIQRHPVDGAEMIVGICDGDVTAIVRHHHERIDGGGYPDGLAGEDIPLGARIIAVADTFDAMTSVRAYRRGYGHRKVLGVLEQEAGAQLDAAAVAAFLSYYAGRRAVAWWALLTATLQRALAWFASTSAGFAGAAQGALALGGAVVAAGIVGHQAPAYPARGADLLRPRAALVGLAPVASGYTSAAFVQAHTAGRRTRRHRLRARRLVTRSHHGRGRAHHRVWTPVARPGPAGARTTATTSVGSAAVTLLPLAAPTAPIHVAPSLVVPVQRKPLPPLVPASRRVTLPAPPVKIPSISTRAVTTPAVTVPAVTTPTVTTPTVTTPVVTTPTVTVPAVTTPVVTPRPVPIPPVTTPTVTVPVVTVPTVTTPTITTPTPPPPPHPTGDEPPRRGDNPHPRDASRHRLALRSHPTPAQS